MKININNLDEIEEISNIKEDIIKIFSNELHEIDLENVVNFLKVELNSVGFIADLERYYNKVVELNNQEDISSERLIYVCILLGFGRNRTIEILKKYNVNRGVFEEARDKVGLKESQRRINNEKIITRFKSNSSARMNRYREIKKINWEELRLKYINGESPINLSKEYSISSHLITLQLKEENVYDENRSTLTKSRIAKEKEKEIDDDFIMDLIKNNPLDSKDLLWEKSKEKYPWILRTQFFEKIDSLGLTRTEEEVNMIRQLKSKSSTNKHYMVKVNGYKAVEETFGSVDNLVNQYMSGKLGSYLKIADYINSKISFDYKITKRQVVKIITSNPRYTRKRSSGQNQLYNFIKRTFPDLEVIEEYSYSDTNKRIDVYIPELKIGLEFNGDHWHSDTVIQYNYGKTAHKFHEERKEELEELGIKLVYVWENDWDMNYQEVENSIINLDWNADILNKYQSEIIRHFGKAHELNLFLENTVSFLEEHEIDYMKNEDSSTIEIKDLNVIINIKPLSK